MPHADKHQPDNRTAKELAQAIWDHPLVPSEKYSMTFNEYMSLNPLFDNNRPRTELLITLADIRQNGVAGKASEEEFKNALTVLANLRRELMNIKNVAQSMANPDSPPQTADEAADKMIAKTYGSKSVDHQKEALDDMGNYAVAINNLNNIESLIKKLADKLHIRLNNPTRGRG